MTYFPKNVMKLILSYNDTSAQRAEKKRQIAPIKDSIYLMYSGASTNRLSHQNRGYEHRKKGVIYWIFNKKVFMPSVSLPLYKESILVRNNTMLELKQYCRDNQLKGFSKHTSKQKLSGFIMKQNF